MDRDYSNLQSDDLELIIKEGLKSDFWKWFTTTYDEGQKAIVDEIVSRRMTGWDDLVTIVKLISSYKSREEIFNFPMTELNVIRVDKENKLRATPNAR